jgi:hypothetical protein
LTQDTFSCQSNNLAVSLGKLKAFPLQ